LVIKVPRCDTSPMPKRVLLAGILRGSADVLTQVGPGCL
jgi:hypothetical protein